MAGQAAAVGDHVGGCELIGDGGVEHSEAGQVFAHALIPVELAFVGDGPPRGYGERFRDGADGEEGMRRHWQFFRDVAVAVAFTEDDFAFGVEAGEALGVVRVDYRPSQPGCRNPSSIQRPD